MIVNGMYQWVQDGELKCCRSAFQSTGLKTEDGKVIWQKLHNGKRQNIFAEQFRPNVPWATGRWFMKMNGGIILEQHPEFKVETERSKTMSDAEYIQYLKNTFEF